MEDKLHIQPKVQMNNFWFKQVDIRGSPSISLFNTGEETKSGLLNGIKVLVDLGNITSLSFNSKQINHVFQKSSIMPI